MSGNWYFTSVNYSLRCADALKGSNIKNAVVP
jgi:hypothetical protein